ncbi:MAG: MFS transporter [Symbiobacteriia bacterium]
MSDQNSPQNPPSQAGNDGLLRKAGRAFLDGFAPLKVRNLRIYLSGQAVSLLGTWMQITAQSWVVWTLSKSPFVLGLVPMLGSLPLLVLGPWTGVLADRLDRRRVLIATQTIAMLGAFAMALLVQTHLIRLWHVYILALVLGIVSALDFPSQQAFIGDLAGVSQIRKAVVLNAMIFQLSRMLGPALAGWVVGALGAAPAFWLNGVSFLAVIGTLLAIHGNQERAATTGNSSLEDFREGLGFIAGQPRIQDLLGFAILVTVFGISAAQLLPAFATDVFGKGAAGLGTLMGASGAGALISSIFIVPVAQRIRRTGLVLTAAIAWTGLTWVAFSTIHAFAPAVVAIFLGSLTLPVVMTTTNGMIQFLAPPNMRARVVGAYLMLSFGMQPISSLFVGLTGKYLGPPTAVLINGTLMVLGGVALIVFRPGLRSWAPYHLPTEAGGGQGQKPGQPERGHQPALDPTES